MPNSLNVLITGSNGQLGSEIKDIKDSYSYNFFFTSRDNLDITDEKAIEEFCKINEIDAIVNCAGYTAVDKAEEDIVNADKINHLATQYLATVAKNLNIKLVHVSTDYVFDGTNHIAYKETDPTSPIGIYAQSKLDGENAMLSINPKASIIIRTSWVYSAFNNNFVKTMIRLGKQKDEIGVIFDQIGTPTYAKHLGQTILDILPRLDKDTVEIYNYSNEGVLSWYDFAKEIMKMCKLDCKVNPLETYQYPTPAKRPHFSLLNKSKIKSVFNIEIPYWKDGLDECLRELGERK